MSTSFTHNNNSNNNGNNNSNGNNNDDYGSAYPLSLLDLPAELISRIVSFVPVRERVRSRLVSVSFRRCVYLSWYQDVIDLSPWGNKVDDDVLRIFHGQVIRSMSLYWCKHVTDKGLRHLRGVRALDLNGCEQITSDGLRHLIEPDLSDPGGKGAAGNLMALDLTRTEVEDLSALVPCTKLVSLQIRVTRIKDLSPLASLTCLRILDLSDSVVEDLMPILPLSPHLYCIKHTRSAIKPEHLCAWYQRAYDEFQAPIGAFGLAGCFRWAIGVETDTHLAEQWLKTASELGHDIAQLLRGVCYHLGALGLEQNRQEALSLFRLSAASNNFDAQFCLGMYYQEGMGGVERDLTCALEWLTRSSERTRLECMQSGVMVEEYLGVCYYVGHGGLPIDYERAVYWFQRYRRQSTRITEDLIAVNYYLGMCYYNGWSVVQSRETAVSYFTKAAESGHVLAREKLASCLLSGDGCPVDSTSAVKLLEDDFDPDFSPATYYMLGCCYRDGTGVDRDFATASESFTQAALQGHCEALAAVHFTGLLLDCQGWSKPPVEVDPES
eukprot:TRINITY_DN569_c1_g1_i1.p1 TRINITY_DN569_c1_g1~~TRINITY_DN569_c1_g1_i1.p1  ORF type:complete len:553 (+),score=111.75 TRINITY_DN569_c1_g1_i1:149-1807(+)